MDIEAIKLNLKKIAPELKKLGVQELFLFGSQAKGLQNQESDFDFLVSFGTETPSLFTLIDLQELLSKHLSRPVDIGTVSMLRPELRDKVLSEALSVA